MALRRSWLDGVVTARMHLSSLEIREYKIAKRFMSEEQAEIMKVDSTNRIPRLQRINKTQQVHSRRRETRESLERSTFTSRPVPK